MHSTFSRLITAMVFLALGITLLLTNLGVWDLDMATFWRYLYPSLFILYGAKVMVDSFQQMTRFGRFNLSWLWGATVLAVGILLILAQLGQVNFTLGMVLRFWPVLLVYIGLSILLERDDSWKSVDSGVWVGTISTQGEGRDEEDGNQWTRTGKSARFDAPNWSVGPMRLTGSVVDYRFDFSKAHIPEGETPIELVGWIGDIKILVPLEVEFAVRARGVVGDIYVAGQERDGIQPKVEYRTQGFDEASRRLTFLVDYRIIDLRIDRV